MMGAAMLKRHQFVQSLWALYRLMVSSIMWGSQVQPLFNHTKTTMKNRGGKPLTHINRNSLSCKSPWGILMSWLRHNKDQMHGCLERAFIQNGGKHYHVIIIIILVT